MGGRGLQTRRVVSLMLLLVPSNKEADRLHTGKMEIGYETRRNVTLD